MIAPSILFFLPCFSLQFIFYHIQVEFVFYISRLKVDVITTIAMSSNRKKLLKAGDFEKG